MRRNRLLLAATGGALALSGALSTQATAADAGEVTVLAAETYKNMAAQTGYEELLGETAVAAPCGFYETASSAYYRHCGSTTVEIRVDAWDGTSDYECVGPWSTTYLGRNEDVDYAVYQHVGCP
jgi:hypothetical protein